MTARFASVSPQGSIDLHTHSSCSDGTDTPADLIRKAAAAGIAVLGLTDHDTTDGWSAAAAALPAGMTLVPGLEVSAVWEGGQRIGVHVLGYLPDPRYGPLADALRGVRASRTERGRRVVELLAADGIPVRWPRVAELAAGAPVGRPHIARALVEAGVLDSIDAAFAGPLNPRSPYYVRKHDIPARQAIELVRDAGGVAALAHPLARRRGRVVEPAAIAAMAGWGLAAIEVDHPDHVEEDRRALRKLAADLGLIALGSSDYHGTVKRTGLAACTTDPASFEALRALAAHPVVIG